jgi:hypothetical protein
MYLIAIDMPINSARPPTSFSQDASRPGKDSSNVSKAVKGLSREKIVQGRYVFVTCWFTAFVFSEILFPLRAAAHLRFRVHIPKVLLAGGDLPLGSD